MEFRANSNFLGRADLVPNINSRSRIVTNADRCQAWSDIVFEDQLLDVPLYLLLDLVGDESTVQQLGFPCSFAPINVFCNHLLVSVLEVKWRLPVPR